MDRYFCQFGNLSNSYTCKIIIADTGVGVDHIENEDYVWGITIILIMFIPNLVFLIWFALSHKGRFNEPGTCAKILIAGSTQLVTFAR